jgi:hypothetical protein
LYLKYAPLNGCALVAPFIMEEFKVEYEHVPALWSMGGAGG